MVVYIGGGRGSTVDALCETAAPVKNRGDVPCRSLRQDADLLGKKRKALISTTLDNRDHIPGLYDGGWDCSRFGSGAF